MFSDSPLDNRTYIPTSEADDEDKVDLWNTYNEGEGEVERRGKLKKEKVREVDAHRTIEAISSTLRLTDTQKNRAKNIFDFIESKQRGVEPIAFACCVIAANKDAEGKRYWAGASDNDERFEEFVEDASWEPLPALNQVLNEL
jgi:hypothetical protein